jgi:EmrB/QacA subfamily drug resistance transporter
MAAVGTGVFLATLDGSIVNVSLPTLVRALETDFATVQWVVMAYLLIITASMLAMGRLADILGKKTVYSWGFIVFTMGSALCGAAPSVNWLIVCRVIQAAGASMMMALGAAILTEAFPPWERGKALGLIGAVVSVAIATGPAVGGAIVGTLSWRWIFYVNLPFGGAGWLLTRRYLPDFKPSACPPFDYAGALILFFSIFSLLAGLSIGQRQGFATPSSWGLICLWPIGMTAFVLQEKRRLHPMVDLTLFSNLTLSISLLTGFICFAGLSGIIILMPFYLENILRFEPVHVGLLMGVVPVMLGITAPISGFVSDRMGFRMLTVMGLAFMTVGYLSAGTLDQETSAVGYLLRMSLIGVGLGIFITPNNSAIMGSAPPHQLGVVSGLMAITRTLGQTVGVSVLGALWAGRTAVHAGQKLHGSTTLAPLESQAAALQDTFYCGALMLAAALILSGWRLRRGSDTVATKGNG